MKKKKTYLKFSADGKIEAIQNGKPAKLKKKKYKDGLIVETNIKGLKRTGENTFTFKYETSD